MDAAEERAAAGKTFGFEADGFIGAARSVVFRKYAEPNPMSLGFPENAIDETRQKHFAVTLPGPRNGNPLNARHAFGRRPIANDGEADVLRFKTRDEVSVTTVGERGAVLCLAPSPDELFVSGQPFRRHDEGNVVGRALDELKRFHRTPMIMRSKRGIICHEP